MKIDRTKEPEERKQPETRGHQVKRIVDKTRMETQQTRYSQRKSRSAGEEQGGDRREGRWRA